MLKVIFQKSVRFWHTIRYLRQVQIISRLLNHFRYVRADLSAHSGISRPKGYWAQPARRSKRMLEEKKFCFLNECHEITEKGDWNNNEWTKLWLYNLHYFDDLNAVDADQRNGWHRALIRRWHDDNPPSKGNGWEPYPSSLRIVNWIKWMLAGNKLDKVSEHSLVVQVRYLSRNLETHLLGNHIFVNAKALLFAGLFFKGKEANTWYRIGMEIVENELPEQVLSDGGNFELSTMYHAIFLEDLLDLVNVHRTFTHGLPKKIECTIHKMIFWLVAMCHPDGEISFFNDAAIGTSPSVIELLSYAQRLGFSVSQTISGLTDLPESGYSRIVTNKAVALVDRAAVGADYIPGHAHADTLSFELSLFGQRAIVNSGTSVYGTSEERLRQRGTAAHATVVVDRADSSEVWGGFRVARRAKIFNYENDEQNGKITISACHNGYYRLPGKPMHCREWQFSENSLVIEDRITGKGEHKIDVVFPLHPDIEVVTLEDDKAVLEVAGRQVEIDFNDVGFLEMKKTTYHPEFGLSIENNKLLYRLSRRLPLAITTRIRW